MSLAGKLYRGETDFDFLGKKKIFYTVSAVLFLVSLLSILTRGFNESIDFKGGAAFTFSSNHHSVQDARDAVEAVGVQEPIVQKIGQDRLRVQTAPLDDARKDASGKTELDRVIRALSQKMGITENQLNPQTIGPTWGKQITNKALRALIVFLIAVVLYISFRFEPKMAASAIVALIHDITITAGIYSVLGFVVSPST